MSIGQVRVPLLCRRMNRAEEQERARDIDVADVNMPVLVRCERLHEPGSFLRRNRSRAGQHSSRLEHAVGTRWTANNHVGVDHHVGQSTVSFQWIFPREGEDSFAFIRRQPMVARNPSVVLVDLAGAPG